MLKIILATAAAVGLLLGGPVSDKAHVEKGAPSISPEAVCPLIYAPVICDKGKIYSNQCLADQHHAKNCVPYGI